MAVNCRRDRLAHVASLPSQSAASLNPDDFTFDLCWRLNRWPTAGQAFVIASKGGLNATLPARLWLALENSSGTIRFRYGYHDGGAERTATVNISTLELLRWNRVVFTRDSGTGEVKLYHGERSTPTDRVTPTVAEIGSATLAGTPGSPSTALRIGCDVDADGLLQNGADISVEEVRFSEDVKDAAALNATASTRWRGDEADRLLYWRCDDGWIQDGGDMTLSLGGTDATYRREDVVYDRGNTGNHGIRVNGASWTDGPDDLYHDTGVWMGPLFGWHALLHRPACAITVTNEVATHPARNLRSARQMKPVYINSRTAVQIDYDFGEPVPVGAFIGRAHNMNSSMVLTLKVSDTSNHASPIYEDHVTFGREINHLVGRNYQARYVRFEGQSALGLGSGAESRTAIGLAMPFTVWEVPEAHELAGQQRKGRDESTSIEMRHGDRVTRLLDRARDMLVNLPQMYRGHAYEAERILRIVGGGAPVWYAPNPRLDLHDDVYGVVDRLPNLRLNDPAWVREAIDGLGFRSDLVPGRRRNPDGTRVTNQDGSLPGGVLDQPYEGDVF